MKKSTKHQAPSSREASSTKVQNHLNVRGVLVWIFHTRRSSRREEALTFLAGSVEEQLEPPHVGCYRSAGSTGEDSLEDDADWLGGTVH